MTPALSIILPVHAAADLASRSVSSLLQFLAGCNAPWEIIVVDDGGNDFDATPLPRHPAVQLLRHQRNLGKGAAVRTGMLAARGAVRLYTDVDLPYDLDLIPTLARHIAAGFHLAVGDRTLPGSQYAAPLTRRRRLLSGVGSRFIGSLVTGGYHDTQCGIKAFRGDVADELFRLVTLPRFAFDVEVIYLALKHRLDIKRVPVQLRRNETTSVRPCRDAARAVVDILGIKVKQLQGRYASPGLETMLAEEARAARAARH
ncbi:MAG: glycosyltransferase [Gemmatimonadota bacterium]|nr:glycosyltransferase [Gemmatimonadota bacterium]